MDFDIQNNVLKKYEGSDSSVIIPQGVTEIGYAAFYKYGRMTSVSIPSSVKKIRDNAFSDCAYLKDVFFQKV